MTETVDISKLAFAAEDFLGPLTREAECTGERTQELDDLCDVIIVFAVFGAGLGVKEIVACDEFKNLYTCTKLVARGRYRAHG